MERSNKSLADIALEEMLELVQLAMKYSPKQAAIMAYAVDYEDLYDAMSKRGATEEELRTVSELENDLDEICYSFIDHT